MKNILFLCAHGIEDAGCRYRVYQFIPYFREAQLECTVWPFSTATLFRALRSKNRWFIKIALTLFCSLRRWAQLLFLSRYNFVVIHREVFPFLIPFFERWVTARHPHVIFSFDDAVHARQENISSMNHPLLYKMKYGSGINEVLRNCECVIAGNRILAEHARTCNENVFVVPTVVDCERYSFQPPRSADQAITIGWMGSRSTVSYLNAIEPALKRIEAAYPNRVRFRFYGFPEYRTDLSNAESLPFRLETEITDLRTLDIGLMPMPDTEWTRGKCAFKAIQYMALGIPTVASPVGVTVDLIQHGENGFLATSADEWFNAIRKLIDDLEVRNRVSKAARRTIEERYSLEVWGPRFVQLFDRCNCGSESVSKASA